MSKVDDLIREAEAELGYLEKGQKYYDKYGVTCLYPKTDYAGDDNLTKFAIEAKHPQGEPWCQTFIAALFARVFGRQEADRLLCGKLASASTMEVKQAMCEAGRRVQLSEAKVGDLVYRSRSGGGHVGLVTGWKGGEIVTIEGNSSSSEIMSWNGGAVVRHIGAPWMWAVRPDYAAEGWHWVESGGVWYYQDENGKNTHGWAKIKETAGQWSHWYYFNVKGQMLTGHQWVNGKLCLFMPDGPLKGAMCISDANGYQDVWNVE